MPPMDIWNTRQMQWLRLTFNWVANLYNVVTLFACVDCSYTQNIHNELGDEHQYHFREDSLFVMTLPVLNTIMMK